MSETVPLPVNLNWMSVLSLVITIGLPYLVGLLTKQSWAPHTKGLVLLGLALLKSVIEQAISSMASGSSLNLVEIIYSTVITAVIAAIAYLGFLKHTPLADAAQRALVKDDPMYDPHQFDASPKLAVPPSN